METTLIWKQKNDLPDHDCYVLVLCQWHIGVERLSIFSKFARAEEEVRFSDCVVIGWAEVNMEEIELGISNNNFNEVFVNFLHNNIKNL